MKKYLLILVAFFVLISCSADEQGIKHKVYVMVDSNTNASHASEIRLLTNIDNLDVSFNKIYENILYTDLEKIDFLVSAEERDRLLHIFVWVDNRLVINQKGYLDIFVSYSMPEEEILSQPN